MQFFLDHLVDLIYILLAVITVIIFTKRGFVESVFHFGRTVMAALICYFAGPSVSKLIYEAWIYKGVHKFVSEKLWNFVNETASNVDVNSMVDSLPFFVRQLVDRESLVEKYGNSVLDFQAVSESLSETLSRPISSLISNLIAYVMLFWISLLVLFIVFKLLNSLFELPILRKINRTLGFLFGLAAAFLLLAVITFVLGVIIGLFASVDTLKQMVETSTLFGWFNKLSLFDLF